MINNYIETDSNNIPKDISLTKIIPTYNDILLAPEIEVYYLTKLRKNKIFIENLENLSKHIIDIKELYKLKQKFEHLIQEQTECHFTIEQVYIKEEISKVDKEIRNIMKILNKNIYPYYWYFEFEFKNHTWGIFLGEYKNGNSSLEIWEYIMSKTRYQKLINQNGG